MGNNHLILKGGHLRGTWLDIKREKKKRKNEKGKKKSIQKLPAYFSQGILSPTALCLV